MQSPALCRSLIVVVWLSVLTLWLFPLVPQARAQAADTLNLGIAGTVVRTSVVQPDGKILIGGSFYNVLGVARNNIARLNADGTLDGAFNPNIDGSLFAIAIQADGKILVGGDFSTVGGQTRHYLARLDATTGAPDSFDPNPQDRVYTIAIQPDGKIMVGGSFEAGGGTNSIGGQPRNNIARLDATGLADSFNPDANSDVTAIAIQPDGRVLVGGSFNVIGGKSRNGLARLDAATGVPDSFNPDAGHSNQGINAIAVQPDGKIVVAGGFTNVGGQPRNRLARLDATTGQADSFNPNPNQSVSSIAVQADGKVFVGGGFTNIGGQTLNYLARLDATTGSPDSFNANVTGSGGFPDMYAVYGIGLQPDGRVLITGDFTSVGGQPRRFFARLSNDVPAQQQIVISQDTVTWTRGGSSPHLARATFEYSNDSVTYTFLGDAISAGSDWTLTGLGFPTGTNFYIRARGYYRSGQHEGSESITESVRNAFLNGGTPPPGVVGNVSTRLPVGSGDNALIEGFIVQGTQGSSKKIMVRALGPSLTGFGVVDALANPTLEIHDSSGDTVATNNDWKNTQVGGLITGDQSAEISSSGLAPGNDAEAAIIANLAPGSYTAVVRGAGDSTGTGVVDAYDLSGASPARLANIATRGLIQAGDKLMIAGFIVQNAPAQAVVRAIGPSLLNLGISNALPDTTLQVRNQNGVLLVENDNWKTTQREQLENLGLQPSHDLEAALVATLQPGQYTAQVRGKNDASGIGVVQVYFLH
jgi:uncharacterized delta-60 repeat protein